MNPVIEYTYRRLTSLWTFLFFALCYIVLLIVAIAVMSIIVLILSHSLGYIWGLHPSGGLI